MDAAHAPLNGSFAQDTRLVANGGSPNVDPCIHPFFPASTMVGSDSDYRTCAKLRNFDLDEARLLEIVLGLLPVRQKCLAEGIDAIPMPNLTAVEIELYAGRVVDHINLYEGVMPVPSDRTPPA